MKRAIVKCLDDAGLARGDVFVGATPRRTVVRVSGLAAARESKEERARGPPASRAFEEDGTTPTKAALGFAKKNGVDPADLENDGEYVWANVKTVGRSATEVLGEALPGIIGGLNFPKTMRWNGAETFSRPVRWLVAMHGDHHVPFVAAGVPSGTTTRLLRNSATPVAEVSDASHHADLLAADRIEIDVEKRREAIWSAAIALADGVNGVVPPSSGEPGGLIDEVVNLVESPKLILGDFDPAFLALPKEVLVMVMRKHQRYFPVEDASSGELLPHFITAANGDVDEDAVRVGNESVLTARYQDARFFYEADTKRTLAAFKPELEGITFQTELGTMLEKTARVEKLAPALAKTLGFSDADAKVAAEAASLAKADLATQLVTEFTSLAGVMGKHYAKREGLGDALCEAIFEAALPRSARRRAPPDEPGRRGRRRRPPRHPRRPLRRRRRAQGDGGPLRTPPRRVRRRADARRRRRAVRRPRRARRGREGSARGGGGIGHRRVPGVRHAAPGAVPRRRRVRRGGGEGGARGAGNDPAACAATAKALDEEVKREGGAGSDALKAAMTVLARPTKLVRGKDLPEDLEVKRESLVEPAEVALFDAYVAAAAAVGGASEATVGDLLGAAATLVEPSEKFFDEVFVMAEDPELRRNRLALMNAVASLPKGVVDFAELPGF